ncbi:MAG: helix-turn-helix domain-containing protein [Chloroflexota bacterium]
MVDKEWAVSQSVGELLQQWRTDRNLSQMDVALEANVSTRHLSFVETGRARPSDDLLLRLAEVLDLSARHTNVLLVSAGYAPQYNRWTLADDETGMVRYALERMLAQHNPFPAFVIDRHYDILLVNEGFYALTNWLSTPETPLYKYANVYELMLEADALPRYISNCDVTRHMLLTRLHEESVAYNSDRLAQLHAKYTAEDAPDKNMSAFDSSLPVLTLCLEKDGIALEFFSTVTAFGTAIDATVQELRIESLFPVNDITRDFFADDTH